MGNSTEDGGILCWTDNDDDHDSIALINNEHIFNILSEFHLYCHGRELQIVQLNKEAEQNAVDLQEIMDILDDPPAQDLDSTETDIVQQNTTCNNSLLNTYTGLTTSAIQSITQSNSILPTDNCDYRLIKSSKGRDKLLHEGFIFNFQRERYGKKQWRCQVKNCKGRLHITTTNFLKKIGEHSHAAEIGAEEVLVFRVGIKRRAKESHDNPHRIIAEIAGKMSEIAKTLLPPEKSLKKRAGLTL